MNIASVRGEVRRFSHGSYTLMHDTDPAREEEALDLVLCITSAGGGGEGDVVVGSTTPLAAATHGEQGEASAITNIDMDGSGVQSSYGVDTANAAAAEKHGDAQNIDDADGSGVTLYENVEGETELPEGDDQAAQGGWDHKLGGSTTYVVRLLSCACCSPMSTQVATLDVFLHSSLCLSRIRSVFRFVFPAHYCLYYSLFWFVCVRIMYWGKNPRFTTFHNRLPATTIHC